VDAWNGRLYVTTSGSSTSQASFFVFDVRNPGQPTLLGALDNDSGAKTGPSAVAVAPSGGKVYAYLASASSFAPRPAPGHRRDQPDASRLGAQVVTYKIPANIVPTAGPRK